MTVESILKSKGRRVYTVRPNQALIEALDMLGEHRIGVVLVMEGSNLIGVLSERDIVAGLHRHRTAALTQTVKMFMSSPVVTCGLKDKIKDLIEVMSTRRIRHLPVVEGDTVIGMISVGDLIKQRMSQNQMEIAVLRDYAIAMR
jgi:CBS domain-containing protein